MNEDVEELETEEEEEPSRISFFSPDTADNDERVTRSIWTMFTRWQNSRGFACRSRGSRLATELVAQQRALRGELSTKAPFTKEIDRVMAEKRKRGELLGQVLAGYQDFEKKHGRTPTCGELFNELGPSVTSAKNVENAISRLKNRGDIPRVRPSKAATPAESAPPKPVAAPPTTATQPASTLDALIAKRNSLLTRAAALAIAIEELSA